MRLKVALRRMFNDMPVMVELLENTGISFSPPCSSIEEIEAKLEQMLGKAAASLVINRLKQELGMF